MQFEPNSRRWVLAGITSYGAGCGDSRYAGVYTRVSAYDSWVRSIVTDGFYQATVSQAGLTFDASRTILSFSSSLLLLSFSYFALSQ